MNLFKNNKKININTKYSPQLDHIRAVAAFMGSLGILHISIIFTE